MKKPYIRLLLFVVLMLALVAGLSYLSLDHVSKTKDEQDDKKMAVALVNEDDGAMFNQSKLDFGAQFVKSMDKNNDQEWYVVSRGVAESGLERGTYDMMIVIPNDFSQKALSLESDAPEQVVLDYKINASDNEKVQAQAEKTASSILNDFNRQIIDVYFASVIGNLQDAQDDVGELVNKEVEHTYTYNTSVHNPLSNYTDRFEAVKNSTATSKDSFSGLEDILNSFEDSLTDRVGSSQDYLSSVDDAEELNTTASQQRLDFMDRLKNYNDSLSGEDVNGKLKNLQSANKYINSQFQTSSDDADAQMKSIAADTEALKKRLETALATVEDAHGDLEEKLENGRVSEEVEDRLSDIVGNAFDGTDGLTELFQHRDKKAKEQIENQISKLPSLDEEAIGNSDLTPEMAQEIKNVIGITKKYNNDPDFGQAYPSNDNNEILPEHIHALQEHLRNKGLTMTDTVKLPENKNKQIFKLHDIPDKFKIEYLKLQLPGQDEDSVNVKDAMKGVKLDPNKPGKFTVELKLRLKDDIDENLQDHDLYNEFAQWSWSLHQYDRKDNSDKNENKGKNHASIQVPDSTLVASKTTDDGEQKTESQKDNNGDSEPENDDVDEDTNGSDSNDSEDSKDTDDGSVNEGDEGTEEEPDDEGDENGSSEEPGEGGADDGSDDGDKGEDPSGEDGEENGGEGNDDDDEPEVEEVEVIDNHIRHQVTKPVIDKSTQNLIHAVENTVAPYQKLLSTYETYFGFDLTSETVDKGNLKDLATEDSLYRLFNETNVKDLMTGYIIDQIEEDVQKEINSPLVALENQMDNYRSFIGDTEQNAAALVEKAADTRKEARNLNDNLEETLNNISDWRDKSMNLVDSQSDVRQKQDEEQRVVMSLGNEFRPLLSQSQSLADRASSNLDSADNVYQTFDRIDEQAESIQQSGTDLVQQAEDLSINMTDKVVSDQEFADNFSEVMDNSRIGDRQNEELYDFLSSPVNTQNKGMIVKGDTFTPYFLVLICFIVALFTAYVISTSNQRRMAEDQFEQDRSLMGGNALITGITAGIGIVEGLAIGLLSAYFLGISEGSLVMWTGLMILMMLAMLLVSTYLLRQLKMIGMFILLAFLSMYLFLTKALGSGFAGSDQIRAYSPLQYLETMLTNAVQGGSDYQFIMFGVIALIVLAALANLLVVHRTGGNVAKDDEDVAKAQ